MPKIKECPHCGEVLVCKACGQRYTPDLVRKATRRKMTFAVDGPVEQMLRDFADANGISMNDAVAKAIDKLKDDGVK